MNIAVIGGGIEGQAAQRYWQQLGADVVMRDQKDGPDYLSGLDDFDLIVRSPGVHPSKIQTAGTVTSVTQEFLAKCPVPVIGVTGTKGKGTTSSLIAKILEACGYKVWLGGNIGVPALDFLDKIQADDKVVLELSSFQLIDVKQSPQTAVMLMVAEDHLNVHTDMHEYVEAKGNIFRYQRPEDTAVYYAQDPEASRMVAYSQGTHVPYFDESGSHIGEGWVRFGQTDIMPVSEVGLVGEHNWQNVCAAVAAVWNQVHDPAVIRRAVSEFTGLPHRLKLVGQVAGVRYYDDSIATTPESAIAAIKSFAEPKVVILGGSDKGARWDMLAQAVKESNVRQAIVIGQTAPAISSALKDAGYNSVAAGLKNMDEVVGEAGRVAKEGDVVLLSPGCASFGMFSSYQDRGDQFASCVRELSD